MACGGCPPHPPGPGFPLILDVSMVVLFDRHRRLVEFLLLKGQVSILPCEP